MTEDLVKRLRGLAGRTVDLPTHYEMTEAADRIDKLQDIIAKIQYTNLRRDINAKNRTIEIEKLCKGKKDERGDPKDDKD
jgi:hypothetical protein